MKEGRVSSFVPGPMASSVAVAGSSVAHLSIARSLPVMSWVGAAPVAQFLSGPSCGQGGRGACRSKGTVVAEHVPDRLGLATGDLDRGDLAASLSAVAGAHPLDDRSVAGVAAGRVGGLDQRPAEVVGPVLAQRPAAVALAGLVDLGAEAGVADQLARCREAGDVADLGGDREPEDPGDARAGHQQRDVVVVGAQLAQLALSHPWICSSRLSIKARLARSVDAHGSGNRRRSSKLRPPAPNRSLPGLGTPCWNRIEWTRFFSELRCLTRCSRKRARSRSALTAGSGSQISGTRSSRASSASTQQSILSVLQASGASPRAFTASAIRTSHPASSSRSCTKRAPLIDSITASTGASPSRCTSFTSPSRSGGTAPIATRSPSRSSACQSRRLRLRSNPTYNTAGASLRLSRTRGVSLHGRPSFIRFLTMRSKWQLVATHGNGFRMFLRFLRPLDLRPVAT